MRSALRERLDAILSRAALRFAGDTLVTLPGCDPVWCRVLTVSQRNAVYVDRTHRLVRDDAGRVTGITARDSSPEIGS